MTNQLINKFLIGAFYRDSTTVSPDEIEQILNKIKLHLEQKIVPGGHYFLLDKDPLRFSLTFFYLLDLGAIPIPVSPEINDFQHHEMAIHASSFAWIEKGELSCSIKPEVDSTAYPQTYACFTSGTTSTPKLCYLSIKGALENAGAHADSMQIDNQHTLIQNLPLSHSFGLITYLWTKVVKGCGLDFNKTFLGLKTLSKRTYKKGVLHASPSQLKFMLKEKTSDIDGLDILSFGAGVVCNCDILSIKKHFKKVRTYVSYGLTEAGPRVTSGEVNTFEEAGFIGKAIGNIELEVFDKDKGLLIEGKGRLVISSPSIKKNLESHESLAAGSKLLTRDFVKIKEGKVYFLSRQSDLIKVSGISVYPLDITTVAKRFAGVLDCIVLVKPHPLYGETPQLVVEGTCNTKELQSFLQERLSAIQMPREIVAIDEFPRHSLNKVDRVKLKSMIGNQ